MEKVDEAEFDKQLLLMSSNPTPTDTLDALASSSSPTFILLGETKLREKMDEEKEIEIDMEAIRQVVTASSSLPRLILFEGWSSWNLKTFLRQDTTRRRSRIRMDEYLARTFGIFRFLDSFNEDDENSNWLANSMLEAVADRSIAPAAEGPDSDPPVNHHHWERKVSASFALTYHQMHQPYFHLMWSFQEAEKVYLKDKKMERLESSTLKFEKFKKGLECGICLQTFCVPITVPCSHTFCYSCLLKCFSPPTGKGSDKTFFQVEKCALCRGPIRLELTPSLLLRELAGIVFEEDDDFAAVERRKKVSQDLEKLKKHKACIRLGAHCSNKMCLRPKVPSKVVVGRNELIPPSPAIESSAAPPILSPSISSNPSPDNGVSSLPLLEGRDSANTNSEDDTPSPIPTGVTFPPIRHIATRNPEERNRLIRNLSRSQQANSIHRSHSNEELIAALDQMSDEEDRISLLSSQFPLLASSENSLPSFPGHEHQDSGISAGTQ